MGYIAACVYAVAKRLKLEEDCELALVGGVFRAGDLVLQPMQQPSPNASQDAA